MMEKKKLYILIVFSSAFARAAQTEQNMIGSISFEKCIQNDRNHAPINLPCIWYFVCVWLRVCVRQLTKSLACLTVLRSSCIGSEIFFVVLLIAAAATAVATPAVYKTSSFSTAFELK